MVDIDHPSWPMRPRLTGRFELILAVTLTITLATFLISGFFLAASLDRVVLAKEYAEPGTVVSEGVLYLGSSNIGSDFFGDIVNSTWFCLWITGTATLAAMSIAWFLSRVILASNSFIAFTGRVLLRVLCSLAPMPVFGLIIVSGVYYPDTLFPLFCLLVAFSTPFFVQYFSQPLRNFDLNRSLLPKLTAIWLRRCSTLSMLLFLLGFFFWLRDGGYNTLSDQMRDNATLITFGVYIPVYPIVAAVVVALTLRLWATIIEDRVGLRLDPYADIWIFLPTILEDELDEARVRKEYEGLY